MKILLHETKRSRWSLLIWTAVISFMLGITVLIYPEMAPQMNEMTDMFADMGSFTAAFGMDQLNFGEFMGYFAVECGNVLGLGGALFAGITGITALVKEERDRTAEFLLTHPVSRTEVVKGKLLSVLAQISVLNLVVMGVCTLGVVAIGEKAALTAAFFLLFLAYYLLQLEIACITFGISAFLKKGGVAVGLGVGFGFYFLNILSNLTEEAEVLKYITPFAYCEGSYIVENKALDIPYITVGGGLTAIALIAGFWYYRRKDIS